MTSPLRFATSAAIALLFFSLAVPDAHAVTIDMVTVGNPGNANDTTGYGAVAYDYRIMKFEFTNSQYATFLNAVDPDGTNPNSVYNSFMGTDNRGGIDFTSGNGAGTKYAVKTNMGDKPVIYVSWWDAARVSNWLHNGAQMYGNTDASASAPQNTGAYTVGTTTSGNTVAANSGALFHIPSENEWYKAAFYDPTLNSSAGGYHVYGNGFDSLPGIVSADAVGVGSAGGTGNFANYGSGAQWDFQYGNVTTVGTNGGASYYGAFDMAGNVWEWNNGTGGTAPFRTLRGGSWASGASGEALSSNGSAPEGTSSEGDYFGFRLASPIGGPGPTPVPEIDPAGMGGVFALVSGALGLIEQRRRRKQA